MGLPLGESLPAQDARGRWDGNLKLNTEVKSQRRDLRRHTSSCLPRLDTRGHWASNGAVGSDELATVEPLTSNVSAVSFGTLGGRVEGQTS